MPRRDRHGRPPTPPAGWPCPACTVRRAVGVRSYSLFSIQGELDECADDRGQRFGLFDTRDMAGVPDDFETRLRYEPCGRPDQIRWRRTILIADDADCRNRD